MISLNLGGIFAKNSCNAMHELMVAPCFDGHVNSTN